MPLDGTCYQPTDPALDTLIMMRRLIENGWIKGYLVRDGKYCLIGAYFKAKKTYPDGKGAIKELSLALYGKRKWFSKILLSRWNDLPQRHKWEVMSLLDRAIASRRSRVLEAVERGQIVALV